MRKLLLLILCALCMCVSVEAIEINNQNIADVWTGSLPQVSGDTVKNRSYTYNANWVPGPDPSTNYHNGLKLTEENNCTIRVPNREGVGNTFTGYATIDFKTSSTKAYGPRVSSLPEVTTPQQIIPLLNNTLTLVPAAKMHRFSSNILPAAGNGALAHQSEYRFNNCAFNFTDLTNYTPTYTIRMITPIVYTYHEDGRDYERILYPEANAIAQEGSLNPVLYLMCFSDFKIEHYPNRSAVGVTRSYEARSVTIHSNRNEYYALFGRYRVTPAEVPVQYSANFINRYCSVGSIESLSFRGCGGANASFNGTLSRNLEVQNSNMTNFQLTLNNRATVSYAGANFSGQSVLSGTIGDLTITDSNVGNGSFNAVAGSANLSRVSFSFNLLQRHLFLQDFD